MFSSFRVDVGAQSHCLCVIPEEVLDLQLVAKRSNIFVPACCGGVSSAVINKQHPYICHVPPLVVQCNVESTIYCVPCGSV